MTKIEHWRNSIYNINKAYNITKYKLYQDKQITTYKSPYYIYELVLFSPPNYLLIAKISKIS